MLGGVPAHATPSTPSAPADAAAAEVAAREAASNDAPPVEIPDSPVPPKVGTLVDTSDSEPDELSTALAKAQSTGKPVELVSQTTETSVSFVQPDGTVQVESAAGPVRTEVDGEWVDVDLTLEFTEKGVSPTAVTGEIVFSDGGTDPMVVLGDGEQTSISLDWLGHLPEPVLNENTAT